MEKIEGKMSAASCLSSKDKRLTLLDCTLRDGGYYTNWHFDQNLVTQYINLCGRIGIDIIELGYLNLLENTAGPFGNLPYGLSSELRKVIDNYPNLRCAAMIDVKELHLMDEPLIDKAIEKHLLNSPSPITVLRFAVTASNTHYLSDYIPRLQDSGYEVCINLMQVDIALEEDIQRCLSHLRKFSGLSSIYLADSFGSFHPQKVKTLINNFSQSLSCPIGYHAHDNIGLALHNSLVAVEAGATWIDSTMYGMGRGAGNAKTEQLVPLLRPEMTFIEQLDLYSFIVHYFQEIHQTHGWGATPLYGVSGCAKIHPTYVQTLEKNDAYNISDRIKILSLLGQRNASKFCSKLLEEALSDYVS